MYTSFVQLVNHVTDQDISVTQKQGSVYAHQILKVIGVNYVLIHTGGTILEEAVR